METKLAVVQDPRLFLFGGVLRSINGKHSVASLFHKRNFPNCVFCGCSSNLTMAHLISEYDPEQASRFGLKVELFGRPTYPDDVDPKSPRNVLRLCGRKGEVGTCHDLFDSFQVGLLYDPTRLDFELFCVEPTNPLHKKRVNFGNFQPYKRLLAWRLRNMIIKFGHLISTQQEPIQLKSAVDFSERASSPLNAAGSYDGNSSSASSSDAGATEN